MADLYVRAPDGEVVVIDAAEAQAAADAGYQTVDDATIRQAQAKADPAAAGGLATGESYNVPQAFAEKALSSATFGLAPGLDSPDAVAGGRRFADEHPGLAFGAEFVGQLPAAIATGGAGAALTGAARGAGLLARGAALAGDVALGAAVGGAQTEAEETRLSGEDFSWTDAAVAGLAGETLGRGAAWGVSRAVGGARNLMARGERDLVAAEAERSLSKGGWLADYRVAQHADKYQNELAELAARDLDTLEESFAEVSRQDRKRARITRAVSDAPEVQTPIRLEAAEGLRALRAALSEELADAPGPAKKLLKQLDDRVEALDAAPTGKRLWRLLDENRQALQEYRQDLHQAYESNPGSAWLSREGLAALDGAEKATREALLREDAWGEAAARMQREYNTPFHEKYFPTAKTVRGKLMDSPFKNAEGFPVFRGDPGKVRSFLARGPDDVDAHRLGEQFRDYLDGVEAIARAGAQDTPAAARNTLEAVRRLRRAVANAAQISEAAARDSTRAGRVAVGVDVAAGIAGAAAFGPAGLGLAGASRGLRVGHWLAQAAERMGWGSGKPLDMAKLLGTDALPPPARPDAPFLDDILDAERPRGPSEPPPSGAPPAPGGGGGGGLTPSMAAAARDPNWVPTGAPAAGATMAEDLAGGPSMPPPVSPREARTVPVGAREVHRGQQEALELDPLRDARGPAAREAARMEALSQGEFADVVRRLKASGDEEAEELAQALESSVDDLAGAGLVSRADTPVPPSGPRLSQRPIEAARQALAADGGGLSLGELRAATGLSREDASAAFMALRERGDIEVRDGLAVLTDRGRGGARPAEEAASAAQAAVLRGAGLEIRMGQERLAETLDTVFGAGRAPTPEQWAQVAPLRVLEQIAPVAKARIDVLGDSFIWSAEGKTSTTGAHRTPSGLDDPGGYQEQSWSISRSFFRDESGRLEVHHDHFIVRGDLQGSGAGAQVLKSMMAVYRDLGVDVVTVDSVEVGKYFWPSIGFDCSPQNLAKAKTALEKWLVDGGHAASPADAAAAVAKVRSLPSLAQVEHAKEFLLEASGPWNMGLKLELSDASPQYHLMRGRLDIALGGLAALGGWALEGKDGEQPGGAAGAAAMGGLGLFGRRVGLFKQARARLVSDVAKRLFSATAEPVARTTARLVYSRTDLKARQDEFSSWQANPQELVDRVAEGFRDVPPEHSGTVASGVFAAATFLKGKLPTAAKLNAISLRQIPVSTDAMAKYARYEQAALRPREALAEAAAGGHISTELLETLGELYPDLLAELRVGAIQQVRENGAPTTIQSKLAYARLFDMRGELADPAFSTAVASMTAYAFEQAVPPKPGGGPTSSGNISHVAAASAAPRMGVG